MAGLQRAHIIVRGRVQGVFFRAHTAEMARAVGLTGSVRNCPDGSVEIVAEGPKETLEPFLEWCRHGPPLAHVVTAEVRWEVAAGEFPTFIIA
ncbi:MAG: acylphosphatase [Deltaproteobacteria bacterium]|nr:acylphosphatase [Deltaproteobacteria bacterium]